MIRKLLTLLCLASSVSPLALKAQEPVSFERVANAATWHRLMHYRKATLDGFKSDLDGPGFFFSPQGKTDPLAELKASAEAFGEDIQVGKLKQHPQCAFPERYRYLKNELALSVADVPCPKLDEFLARFHRPKSVSMVFSNAYPDNPASMFGHTFLRINAGDSSSKLDLLDQGISYAANVGLDENPLVFYWLGLTGGYPGAFSVVPYYVKVNEYSHAETRDLWEYDLDLNSEQTLRLLRHLWEIETNSWFDYWFFDENCAYELLTLLEVARPDWNLSERAGVWVIPGESVKILTRTPGAVKSIKYRPSYRRTLLKRFEALNSDQREKFFEARKGKVKVADLSDVQTIDALSADLTYEKQKNNGKLSAEDKALLTQTLIRRSELGASGGTRELADENSSLVPPSGAGLSTRPDLGHDSTRLSLSGGIAGLVTSPHQAQGQAQNYSGLYFQEIHWRSAYHDLLNNDVGYLSFSQIEFPNLTLRYYPKLSDLRVERIGLLSVLSLFPMSALEKKPSWGLDLAYQSPKDYGCLNCHTLRGRAMVGAAGLPISMNLMFYGLALVNAEAGESLRKGWRFGPGGQIAAIANPIAPYKLQLRYELVSDLFQNDRSKTFYELSTEHSWSLNSMWELRAQYSFSRNYDEAKLGFQYYF